MTRIVGLDLTKEHTIRLRALNEIGPGPASTGIKVSLDRRTASGVALPPRPEGFTLQAGATLNIVTWDNPTAWYGNHGQTLIFRNTIDDYANAEEIGFSTGISYVDNIGADEGAWYWLVWESDAGIVGPPTGGKYAQTAVDIDTAITTVNDEVFRDPLTALLLSPIEPLLSAQRTSFRNSGLEALRLSDILGTLNTAFLDAEGTTALAFEQLTMRVVQTEGGIAAVSMSLTALSATVVGKADAARAD